MTANFRGLGVCLRVGGTASSLIVRSASNREKTDKLSNLLGSSIALSNEAIFEEI